ncbi:MAG: YitT family protein [Vigna little leaf phytoplasma]|nr:YitT family protein [Vigna little leaf phytoplasma]
MIITMILCLGYILQDVIFLSEEYDIKLYTSGIHGIGDAIAKIIKETNLLYPLSQKYYFVSLFAAIFFLTINIFLFLFIAWPKLDLRFSINSLIYSFFFTICLIILNFLIKDENSKLSKIKYCFGFFSKEDKFGLSFLRVLISAIISGIIHGICIRIGSSTAGTDIIAKYLSIYKKKDISLIIGILNYLIGIIAVIFLSIYNKKLDYEGLFLTFFKTTLTTLIIYLIMKINFKKINPHIEISKRKHKKIN